MDPRPIANTRITKDQYRAIQQCRLQDALTQLDGPGVPQDGPRSLATYAQLEAHHKDINIPIHVRRAVLGAA